MHAFPRDELEEMMRRWVAANDRAGETGDWDPMGDFYTDDSIYTWNNGSKYEFVARGKKEIRDWVFGTEMEGLGRWTYPYVRELIDEKQGEIVGFWKQIA
ncbi:MAG: nuclear transport factor 2 family protein, partial [Myxococcota bacterium]